MKPNKTKENLEIALEENYLNYINQYPEDKDAWLIAYLLSKNAIERFSYETQ